VPDNAFAATMAFVGRVATESLRCRWLVRRRPIEIPFEANIGNFGEALERLDELGDILDGSISQSESREPIDRLS